jgi:hypothetical protein
MKRLITTAFATALLATSGWALDFGQGRGPNPDTPRTGDGAKQQKGKNEKAKSGKRAGPQDGSGPIHTPGTGGGNGGGQRRGGGRR